MAASSKSEPSFGGPDKPSYATGQRGSYNSALIDRPGSFREGMDNPILSALPNMSRTSLAVTQYDVKNFLSCLRFDSKLVAPEHRVNRQIDHKRHITSLEASLDDAPTTSSRGKLLPSPLAVELKQIKGEVRESSHVARERTKIFGDALSTFNKCFPSVPSRKRSRLDALFGGRSSMNKMGNQNHATTGVYEFEQQKADERVKGSCPNKHTRTSVVDAKMDIPPTSLSRPCGAGDKDGEVSRLANGGIVQGEDCTLPVGVDGWEKLKMKKKRSVIKPDVALGTISNKPVEGYQEPKHGLQQRNVTDSRSRMIDSHNFRSGVASRSIEVGKADAQHAHHIGLPIHPSVHRTDQDNSALSNDRRDRSNNPDKERVNIRVVNKVTGREDFCSVSPTSNIKMNASARAPRTGSSMVPKLSPVVHRAAPPNDWDFSHCTSKLPTPVGPKNQKATMSTRSSSPPVANWAGQRQQKSSRTARRTNFVPIVSCNDETPVLDITSDVSCNQNGIGSARRFHSNSPQQPKFKGDHFTSVSLSDIEESAAADIKSMDKIKKCDDVDEKAGSDVQKVPTLASSSRRNKMVNSEDPGDGVRRQGRIGRGFASTRALMPMMGEKPGNVGTAKQLRSARHSLDKSESKAGRPPTRKLSDRKASFRQKHATINASAELSDGSDNGHELLAAAKAALNPSHSFSSSFWKDTDTFFKLISDADIEFLKYKGDPASTASAPATVSLADNGCDILPDIIKSNECWGTMAFAADKKRRKLSSEQYISGKNIKGVIPLCQRLLAALIPEEEDEDFYRVENDNFKFDVYGTEYELEFSGLSQQKIADVCNIPNGLKPISNGASVHKLDPNGPEIEGVTPNLGHLLNGLQPDEPFISNIICSELQYNEMSIDEKILLELQSIGIFPNSLPDVERTEEEEISENISKLEDMFRGQVSKNKVLLSELMKSASETKERQEKEFEGRALDKLVGMAYEKYMSCWGPNAPGGKSSSTKMAKQSALAFVKRALEQCREFEETGKSCFSSSLFQNIFRSQSSHLKDVNMAAETDSTKPYFNISGFPMDAAFSGLGSRANPSVAKRMGEGVDNHDVYSSDASLPVTHFSEQPTIKDDPFSNRIKKRELLLDDVGIGASLPSTTKGRRSERDREGKGQRDIPSPRTKIGRPSLSNIKKPKSKPKQRTTQLSRDILPPSGMPSDDLRDEFCLDKPDAPILAALHLPEIDELDEQVQDLGSWLNIDEEGLQDHDFMGLEIPMDDLSELNMMI